MSEYQRYEFMTVDRPLTKPQLEAVKRLSSHIEASATHAFIEYHWGDFKHNPIEVLHQYFDGFLYWANWGSPQLAFRFPHGMLPPTLLDGYDLEDFVTFARHPDYDILDISFGEMEGPDVWTEYDLSSLIGIREEILAGDARPLYIVWLASRDYLGTDDEEEEYEISVPAVPPGFAKLTTAQKALADLFQVPDELVVAAARHSKPATPGPAEDLAAWLKLLPPARRDDYLLRLANDEPGLSRMLVRELRELGSDTSQPASPEGEHVTYATLLPESKAVRAELDRQQREKESRARERRLRDIHEHKDDYWHRADEALTRTSGTSYDEATQLLVELRDAANHFDDAQPFQERFRAWVQPHLRRPAFVKRLRDHQFTLPE